MGRKIIFFDIDGTLVDTEDRTVPASAVEAIRRARAGGHLLYINSGRPYMGIDPRVKELDFDGYACGCGLYIRIGDEVLWHKRLEKEAQLAIVDMVRRYELQVMYEGWNQVFFDLSRPIEPHVMEEKAYYASMGLDTDGDVAAPGSAFDKFVVWEHPGADMDGFRREISRWYQVIDREGTMFEMVPLGCSKGNAMERLMTHHGLTRADCIAIGDGVNDLPMLEAAGTAVAMGNSDPRILDRVDYVTSHLRENGIARALEHLGVI